MVQTELSAPLPDSFNESSQFELLSAAVPRSFLCGLVGIVGESFECDRIALPAAAEICLKDDPQKQG